MSTTLPYTYNITFTRHVNMPFRHFQGYLGAQELETWKQKGTSHLGDDPTS